MGKQLYGGSRALNFMRGLLAFVLSALMGIGFVALTDKTHDWLAGAAFEQQAVVGTWQGNCPGIPSIMVTIDRDGDKLSGTVVFQAIRKTESGPKPSSAPVTLALREGNFDGKTLHFKLDDQRASPELRESGIEMTLTSANQAELKIASTAWDSESVTMIKNAWLVKSPSLDLVIAKAFRIVVVDHTHRLHESVTDGRPDELETTAQQVFT